MRQKLLWVGAAILGSVALVVAGRGLRPQGMSESSSPSVTYRHDERGNLVEVTEDLGPSSSFPFYNPSVMVKPVDPNGKVCTYEYNDHCTRGNGDGRTYSYDADSNLSSVTEATR